MATGWKGADGIISVPLPDLNGNQRGQAPGEGSRVRARVPLWSPLPGGLAASLASPPTRAHSTVNSTWIDAVSVHASPPG
jgi:hypothetical protein